MSISPETWFQRQGWQPHDFQKECWQAFSEGYSGLINAPTGSGKTYAAFLGAYLGVENIHQKGLLILWITPIRALAAEIANAIQKACTEMDIPWDIGSRTGDTDAKERRKMQRNAPQVLITTPESLHLMLAQKGYPQYFENLSSIVIDEWHELLGSKRGVQVELALSRLRAINGKMKTWGISATIGNLSQALEVLLGINPPPFRMIKANLEKKIEVQTIYPDEVEKYPWAGHLGIKLLEKVIPILNESKSTLIFTNTRSQAEIWYQKLLEAEPDLAGKLAIHHGSIGFELRNWVEAALHTGYLKAVVCTSSLDLGVDFRPVETVIQIGSAKGVARFIQRAGRSGHAPGKKSKIYFLPTNSLEIAEASAVRTAIEKKYIENRLPYVRSFDVLIQYLVTLAVSEGFYKEEIFKEIKQTHCYSSISEEEWHWILMFITKGGKSLESYDEYHKVEIIDGKYKVTNRRIALRHRLSIGTIVSDAMLTVKLIHGKRLGAIEEWFISQLNPGDVFWFAGRSLEFVQLKDLEVLARKSKSPKGKIPSWQGGRMSLSSELSDILRKIISDVKTQSEHNQFDEEINFIKPLFDLQSERSALPSEDEFLIEVFHSKEGHHLFFYPFEGRLVHEGMAAVIGGRLTAKRKATFSIAMNDYGFELLSDQEFDISKAVEEDIFNIKGIADEAMGYMNGTQMASRRFRDIASIAGLVFQGYPGKPVKTRHIQANSSLFYRVFQEYDPDSLLLRQAYDEVLDFQLSFARLYETFLRINKQKIIIKKLEKPGPFAFPIMTERFREKYSNENIEERVLKMIKQLEKGINV